MTRAVESADSATRPGLAALSLGALGVVFGDIGTSPLYALKECVAEEHGVPPTPDNVYGLLSLIFWALTMVVSIKYVLFVMRADNDGEGGILALLALVPERLRRGGRWGLGALAAVVLFGAALLYGDGIITPAISVLSAVEGLEVAAPGLHRYVVPITCGVLLALFAIQRHGTAGLGRIFGPIMLVWFGTIAVLGVRFIVRHPAVLRALLPTYAVGFVVHHGTESFVVLGAVVLAITGGEALYADMGHFGRGPIRTAWFALVLPALVLNYFGQGALLVHEPSARGNPFFAMVPAGAFTYALVALSATATVIASQALISGAFSLTRQAIQLGYLPRLEIRHTSSETEGQIYIGAINWMLAIACLALVLAFERSTRLAAAYGIAVTGTMAITSGVYFVVLREDWKWPLWRALPLLIVFLSVDLSFFGANLLKFLDGGYVPIVVATLIFVIMVVWRRGRTTLMRRLVTHAPDPAQFIADLERDRIPRVPGTGIFLTAQAKGIPVTLSHYLAHVHALPQRIVLLRVAFEHVPRVPVEHSVEVEELSAGLYRATVSAGFMEHPCLPDRLREARQSKPLALDQPDTTYFVGRETFLATDSGEMGRITESLYSFLYKAASSTTIYFGLPPDRVMEIGMHIDL
ncbi:MAG: Kup system potassium uptake protein [Myxococcales bacterium]|nr:Kup system potassium uptake protein [Myxococcales bacterium]